MHPLLVASSPSPRDSFAVLVTANALGDAKLNVRAHSAGIAYDASLIISVVDPLPLLLRPELSMSTSMILVANASLALLGASEHGGDDGVEVIEWSFCDTSSENGGAKIDERGVLHAGATESILCVLPALAQPPCEGGCCEAEVGESPQTQPLIFEVARIAAIELLVAEAPGDGDTQFSTGAHFEGALELSRTLVCAFPVDSWGRPFMTAALPSGWMQLSVVPAGMVVVRPANSTHCFELEAQRERATAAGVSAALLEVSVHLPEPLPPVSRAFVPLTWEARVGDQKQEAPPPDSKPPSPPSFLFITSSKRHFIVLAIVLGLAAIASRVN